MGKSGDIVGAKLGSVRACHWHLVSQAHNELSQGISQDAVHREVPQQRRRVNINRTEVRELRATPRHGNNVHKDAQSENKLFNLIQKHKKHVSMDANQGTVWFMSQAPVQISHYNTAKIFWVSNILQ